MLFLAENFFQRLILRFLPLFAFFDHSTKFAIMLLRITCVSFFPKRMLLQWWLLRHLLSVAEFVVLHHRFDYFFMMFSFPIAKVVRRKHHCHEGAKKEVSSHGRPRTHSKSVPEALGTCEISIFNVTPMPTLPNDSTYKLIADAVARPHMPLNHPHKEN